jgi:hypothetical protein
VPDPHFPGLATLPPQPASGTPCRLGSSPHGRQAAANHQNESSPLLAAIMPGPQRMDKAKVDKNDCQAWSDQGSQDVSRRAARGRVASLGTRLHPSLRPFPALNDHSS